MSDKPQKNIVIIGATSAIAEHCARLWADHGQADFVLMGRDPHRLTQIADDLRVRSPASRIDCISTDFLDPANIQRKVGEICKKHPDIVLIAHGTLPDQTSCQQDLDAAAQALAVNGVSPVLFAEAFAAHMEQSDHGTLAIIGSVAGDRGRKSNYVYGAAKGMVTRYAQGLQHRFAHSRVNIVLIKPGPTLTPMTAHLLAEGARLASAEQVARQIVSGINKAAAVVYAPGKWWLIMMIVRHLPRFVFNRLNI